MGIFGPLENEEAVKILLDNFDEIIAETDIALGEVGKNKPSINGTDGVTILWNIIAKAQTEIPSYIEKAGLNMPIDYPYSDPNTYVFCTLVYKYYIADKEDKKDLSNKFKKIKKNGIQELVNDIIKVYCDNIEKSLMRPKPYDKQKENAIKVLAENLTYYYQLYSNEQNTNDDGTSRTRK